MSGFLLPKDIGPTPLAIPDGMASIRFTTVTGTAGEFPAAQIQLNWHGSSKAVSVEVSPDGVWPVVPIPGGEGGVAIYRIDDGSHFVGYAFNRAPTAA
jgi:hypothetical protein